MTTTLNNNWLNWIELNWMNFWDKKKKRNRQVNGLQSSFGLYDQDDHDDDDHHHRSKIITNANILWACHMC